MKAEKTCATAVLSVPLKTRQTTWCAVMVWEASALPLRSYMVVRTDLLAGESCSTCGDYCGNVHPKIPTMPHQIPGLLTEGRKHLFGTLSWSVTLCVTVAWKQIASFGQSEIVDTDRYSSICLTLCSRFLFKSRNPHVLESLAPGSETGELLP